jgi:hypothetical protein
LCKSDVLLRGCIAGRWRRVAALQSRAMALRDRPSSLRRIYRLTAIPNRISQKSLRHKAFSLWCGNDGRGHDESTHDAERHAGG